VPVLPQGLAHDLDDERGLNPLIKRHGLPGQFQYIYEFPRYPVPIDVSATGVTVPFRGVRTCAQCDRFALFLLVAHGNKQAAPASQFEIEIYAGMNYCTDLVFAGASKIVTFASSGRLVTISGYPATGWDVYLRLTSGLAADQYDISLGLLLDRGGGSFSTSKGSMLF
jgi:hypothetical protein